MCCWFMAKNRGGKGSIQDSMKEKGANLAMANPLFFLVELRGVEPLAS